MFDFDFNFDFDFGQRPGTGRYSNPEVEGPQIVGIGFRVCDSGEQRETQDLVSALRVIEGACTRFSGEAEEQGGVIEEEFITLQRVLRHGRWEKVNQVRIIDGRIFQVWNSSSWKTTTHPG